jgi:hypothetical protein
MSLNYRCTEYPGMEGCVGAFTAKTEDELWSHIELHGRLAHGEDPEKWTEQERRLVKQIIRQS